MREWEIDGEQRIQEQNKIKLEEGRDKEAKDESHYNTVTTQEGKQGTDEDGYRMWGPAAQKV